LPQQSTAYADDNDDDEKLPAGVVEKVEEVLSTLCCKGYEEVEVEDIGTIEIEDASAPAARWTSTSTKTARSS